MTALTMVDCLIDESRGIARGSFVVFGSRIVDFAIGIVDATMRFLFNLYFRYCPVL